MRKYFNFEDVNLIPKKGITDSRSECDTSVQLGKFKFELPIYPANMESVINEELAIKLAKAGYFYTMHRFGIDQIEFIKKMKSESLVTSISIGVNQDSYDLLNKLVQLNLSVNFITIDIAHGHSIKMEKLLKFIRQNPFFNETFIIAGNICTIDAACDLMEWGADGLKCGLSNGFACTTAMATRFGNRGIQASMVKEISDFLNSTGNAKIKIISDGGIREHGDIVVAMVLGADLVMAGGLLTGFEDSPGEQVTDVDGKLYKKYWGSASSSQSGKNNRIEGTTKLIPLKHKSLLDEMVSIKESIQSAVSYAGGKDLDSLKYVKYIIRD